MKILLIHQRNAFRDDSDETVDRELALLRGAKVEVELWERAEPKTLGSLSGIRSEFSYSSQAKAELAARLASFRPRLVHVHNFLPSFTPSIYDACLEAKVPVIQTVHDFKFFCANGQLVREGKPCELCLGNSTLPAIRYSCHEGSRLSTLAYARMISRHRKENTWGRKVSAFIAQSHFSAAKLVQGGIPKEHIHVKPGFAHPPPVESIRASDLYALYVGKLTKERGLLTLLKAWEGVETPLWIVGDGPLRAELEARKSTTIKVLGEMPPQSISRVMGKAEFLVVPSESYDSFPLPIADAFAFGLPVVASRIGMLAETIRHEKNGLLFEPGNVENLRNVVRKLAKDNRLVDRLGAGARLDYADRFTPKKNLQTLLEIYQAAFKAKLPQTL